MKILGKNLRNQKFHFFLFLFLISYSLTSAQFVPNTVGVPDSFNKREDIQAPIDIESQFASAVCEGNNNIVKAGCSVITGQAVRTVPSMAFGCSLDKCKECADNLPKGESASGEISYEINLSDTCSLLSLYNAPDSFKTKFVQEMSNTEMDNTISINNGFGGHSLASAADGFYKFTNSIKKESFTPQYYAIMNFDKVPFVGTAFAREGDPITDSLSAFMGNTWMSIRNLAFVLISVFALILGIGIMTSGTFSKDPKFNLTLEQAIPKVIIALILIQLSYFIGYSIFILAENRTLEAIAKFVLFESTSLANNNSVRVMNSAYEAAPITAMISYGIAGAVLMIAKLAPIAVPIILIGVLFVLYRAVVLAWLQFKNAVGIVVITVVAPILISLSVLPGTAGEKRINEYFSSLIALFIQALLYQFIFVFAWNFFVINDLITLATNGGVQGLIQQVGVFIAGLGSPLIVAIILMQGDQVVGISNQLAKNLTGSSPLGSQNNG